MRMNDEQLKLKNWMEEYALHRLLDVELSAGENQKSTADFSQEPVPAAGQIRLWPAVKICWPPMYGLLMRAGYGFWRVFPFSELACPATPQELRIRNEAPVRVLQGWNARELSDAQVRHSWFVDALPEADLFRVNLWWTALQAGTTVAGGLQALCGPPLRHPLDPRHEYLDAESGRADGCLGERPAKYQVAGELPKAAEPESDYGKKTENDPSE